jgi:hypothetical protein
LKVSLSPDEISKIITEHMSRNCGMMVEDVKFELTEVAHGNTPYALTYITMFSGATVQCKPTREV